MAIVQLVSVTILVGQEKGTTCNSIKFELNTTNLNRGALGTTTTKKTLCLESQ